MSDRSPVVVDGRAETSSYRIVALAFGPAAIVFALLILPAFVAQSPFFAAWWTGLALFSIVAVPLVLCALSFRGSARAIRRVSGVGAVAFLVGLVLLGPALGGHRLPDHASPWLLGVATIGTTLAALAWRASIAFASIVVDCAFVAIDRVAAAGDQLLVTGLQDGLYTLMFSTVFAALALVATRSGYLVDQAAAAARSEAATTASVRGQLHERGRINALVHDSVLATLLAAGRNRSHADQPMVAAQARSALDQLARLKADLPASAPVSARDFVWSVQALTTDIARHATFDSEVAPGEFIPPDVVEAVSEAAMEALRNSINHADRAERPVNRSVHVIASAEGVVVEILDDGVGFDPERVPPTRLGVAVSIRQRMLSLPGGAARIAAGVGLGTRVRLTWTPVS